MRFLVGYACRHWLSRLGANLRRLALSTALLTVLFVTAAFVPAVRFQSLAAEENAGYLVRMNGPLSDLDLSRMSDLAPGARLLRLSTGSYQLSTVEGRTSPADVYVTDDASNQDLSWFSPPLLIEGRPLSGHGWGEAVLDWRAARELGVGVGDTVRFESRPTREAGVNVSAIVVGIYATSNPLQGAALFGPSAEIEQILAGHADAMRDQPRFRGAGLLFSDVLIGTPLPAELARLEAAFADPEQEVILEERSARLDEIVRTNSAVLGSVWPRILSGGILAVFLLLVMREQSVRLQRRRREIGLLVALGAPERTVRRLLVVEVLAEALMAAVLALLAARWVVETLVRMYLPAQAFLQIVGSFAVVVLVVSVVISVHAGRLFRRVPLGRLVSEEV